MYIVTLTVRDEIPYKVRCVIGCLEPAIEFWMLANAQTGLHATAPVVGDAPLRTGEERAMATSILTDWAMKRTA